MSAAVPSSSSRGPRDGKRLGVSLLLLLLCSVATPVAAQTSLEFSGYVVDLPMYQRMPDYTPVFGPLAALAPNRNVGVNLTRLRLRPTLRLWEGASLSLEHEITSSWSSQGQLFGNVPDITNRQIVDLRWHPVQEDRFQLQHFVDRLYFRQNFLWGAVIVGRQRISWGSGRIWNPTDLFNPINPASFDKIEKDGADAVSFKYYIGDFTDVQVVYNPRLARGQRDGAPDAPDSSNYAARFRTNVDEFDLSLMGGYFDRRTIVGGDFAGNLFDAGVRGEAVWSPANDDRDAYVRFLLGADYQFTSRLYAVIEYLHNGEGTTNVEHYDIYRLFTGEILNLSTDYLYLGGTYLLHPLVVGNFGVTSGLSDGSGFVTAGATWSTSDNSSLSIGALLPFGAEKSEYWLYPASVYMKGECYF